jgi:hypothetical protein
MEKLVSSLEEDSKRLLESADKTGGRRLTLRRQLEQNLANCLLSADTRRAILGALADLDKGLNTSAVGTSEGELPARDSSESDNFEWKPGETSQGLAKLAAWQGLWALLVRSLDPSADSDSENLWKNKWAVLADQARLAESERPFNAETAVDSASSLGDLLRIGWKASAAETGRVRYFSGETEQVTRELVRRDRIARCLPGFDADALIRSNRRDPALDLAAWSDSQLSLFLARQSLDDFYANEVAGSRWFEEACRFHINSANGSSLGASAISTSVSKEISAAQDLLSRRRSSRFWVQADRVAFGSYDRRPALLEVSAEGDTPTGSMAVWLETSKSQSAVQLASAERRDVKVGPSDTSQLTSISIELLRNVRSCDAVSLPARLFYRGHTSSEVREVDVNPCPPAQRVAAALPEPERGSVIVSGTDRRSVLFVLDCSKSMLDALPDGTSKMFTAKAILQKTVAKLQEEAGPSPRRIGLVAFGHRMNRKGTDLWPNPNWPADDLPTDPLVDYQPLVPLRGAAAADPMLFPLQLKRIDSWGMTPLVISLRFSLSQFQSDEPGLLVVITDGADSALEKGSETLKANTRAALKGLSKTLAERKAQGFPVEVHIVGFALDATSKELLKEVFDAVATPSGGRQFAADDGNKLETFLSNAVEPRQYSVVAVGRNDGPKFDLGMASTELGRGEYRLIFPDAEPAPLKISGGERIVFDLRDANLVPRKYQWGSAAGQIARASGAATDPDSPNALVDRGYQIESGQATILLGVTRFERFKSFKKFKPFKSFQEFAPFKPFLSGRFGQIPCSIHLALGRK